MLRTMRTLLAIGILFVSAPLLTAADEDKDVDNPMYVGWAHFKPGATCTLEEKTTYSGEKDPTPDQKIITYTLLNASPEKVVVKAVLTEQDLLGTVESAPTKITYPAKLKKSYLAVAVPDLDAKKGEETIKWKGKDIKCKTLFGSYKKDGEAVEFKAWINDSVPGGVVKRTRTTRADGKTVSTTITLQSYKVPKKD